MNQNTLQSQNLPGGFGGSTPETPNAATEPTIIDLRKPGDLNLVYRSVLNGWDVPQHVRDQIGEQMIPAMDFHSQRSSEGDLRSTSRVIKLCKLLLMMDVADRVDAGERKSLHPIGRKRYPENASPGIYPPTMPHRHLSERLRSWRR